jgi:copper homeostasis protein
MKLCLEAVVDSIAAAVAAEQAGADRLELCTALELGGLTPGIGLICGVVAKVQIPVFVLIRGRAGDFCYRDDEHEVMLAEVEAARLAGARGVVTGSLDHEGNIHMARMRELCTAAGSMALTFHRAFDRLADQKQGLATLIELGITRVLTSGGQASAYEGRSQIRDLVQQAKGRIVVMAGAGVNAANAAAIVADSGVKEIHCSAIRLHERVAPTHNMRAHMGAKGSEADNRQMVPDPEKLVALRQALNL